MDIDMLLPELRRRYPFLDDDGFPVHLAGIREADVSPWGAECGGDRLRVYDEFARYLAIAFHNRRLSFEFCDAVINDLYAVMITADDGASDLFWAVFEAFDAGEFHRLDDRSDDPVAEYTEPAIAAIVANLRTSA